MVSMTMLVTSSAISPHLLVEVGVKRARLRAQMRFQRVNLVLIDERLNGIVLHRMLEIAKKARLGGTDFHARRFQSARDAVVTERAFLGRMGVRIQEAATVRTGLDAKSAAEAIVGI